MRRTYNPVKRVSARSEGPNPSGPAKLCYHAPMGKKLQVRKEQFDAALSRLIHAKPVPRTSIKASSKRSPKPILGK